MKLVRSGLFALSCLFSLSAGAVELPALGDSSSSLVSLEQEYKLGRAWLSILRGSVAQLSDPMLKDYVERHVYRLAETSQLQERRLDFVILDSKHLNAFAAPGGIIGVNGGLFMHAETEAEFASVMAHELAHLSQRHFARGLEAQQRMQLPVMAGILAGVVAAAAGAGDLGMAAILSSQAAAFQEQRRFSRQNEQEADRIGIQNLSRAGYDPRAMPALFERMAKQYRYDRMPPEFLLTHPVTESRIADTQNRAEQLSARLLNPGIVDTLTYQLMRARVILLYEGTPGMALKRFRAELEANSNNTPARYGLALALMRAGQYQEAKQHLGVLLGKANDSIVFNQALIELERSNKNYSRAQELLDKMLKLYPSNYPLKMEQAELFLAQEKYEQAEQLLNQLVKQRPNDPDIWYEISEVRGHNNNIIGLHEARAEFFARVGDYQQAIEQLSHAKNRASNNFILAARIDARQTELINEEQAIKEMFK